MSKNTAAPGPNNPAEEEMLKEQGQNAEEQEGEKKDKNKKIKKSERSVKRYQHIVIRLALVLLVVWILLFKIVGVTRMPNADMYPRIDSGDIILYSRIEKRIRAQDIVVLEKATPDSEGKEILFVGRIVAAPGDTVEITDDQRLVVNGNTMIESNIFYSTPQYQDYTQYPLKLGEGEYFVLCDSRKGGSDSRYFGPVKRSEICGTVITVLRRNNL